MDLKTREEILRELVARAEEHPYGWKAAVRQDPRLFANEYYIFHPKAGVYELKEYQVNPFETAGIGAALGPSVPRDLPRRLEGQAGTFALVQLSLARLRKILEETSGGMPLTQESLDTAIRIPMRGPAHGVSAPFRFLDSSLERKRRVVDEEFRKLVERRGLTMAYA